MVKRFIWRLHGIPAGTPRHDILQYFEPADQERLRIKTLCPDVDDPEDSLTATIEDLPPADRPDAPPRKKDDLPHYLPLDRDFLGFTPLYHPLDANAQPTTYDGDIVAVTGLAGHAIGSWTLPSGTMWLRDFLPRDARTARILTYGYDARIQGSDLPTSTLGDLAEQFLDRLIIMRGCTPHGDQRPIILIGHSLGCLVIKKAMISANYLRNESRLPIRLIIFLAAPHRGMEIEALLTVIKDKPPAQLIHELGRNSPILRELNRSFIEVSEQIQILSAFETLETPTVEYDEVEKKLVRSGKAIVLVSRESAIEGLKNERQVLATANHSTIAKIDKHQGSIYPELRSAIKESLAFTFQVKKVHDKATSQESRYAWSCTDDHFTGSERPRLPPRRDSSDPQITHFAEWRDQFQDGDENARPVPERIDSSRTFERTPSSHDANPSTTVTEGSSSANEVDDLEEQSSRSNPGITANGIEVSSRGMQQSLFSQLGQIQLDAKESGGENGKQIPTSSSISINEPDPKFDDQTCTSCKADVKYPQPVFRCCRIHEDTEPCVCEKCSLTTKMCVVHKLPLARFGWSSSGGQTLFRIFVDPELRDQDSVLVRAIKSRNLDLVDDLAKIASLRNLQDENGFCPLHVAVHLGLRDEAERLLRRDADIEATANQGRTPLAVAVWALQLPLVKLLLQYGARRNAVDHREATPLLLACIAGSAELVTALISANPGQDKSFIEKRNRDGWTPLGAACLLPNVEIALEIARLLLDAGANPTITGHSPSGDIMHAIQEIPTDGTGVAVVRLLVQYGAGLNSHDPTGYTPLGRAAARGYSKMCQILIDCGAGRDAEDKFGASAIYWAAYNGRIDTVRVLLAHGASAKPPSILKTGKWEELSFQANVTPKSRAEFLALLNSATPTWRGVAMKLLSSKADMSTVDDIVWLVTGGSSNAQQVINLFQS